MLDKLIIAAIIIWLAFATCPAQAQEPSTSTATTTAETTTASTTTASTTTAGAASAPTFDVNETRERLREVLHRLPPEVGRVLKIDTSLWSNETYIASYPPLAQFLATHPEVARNPHFYTRGVWIPTDDAPPESASVRLWRQMMEGVFVLFGVTVTVFVFTWVIRKIIEHRRWSRLARIQTEVHNKLLDRFGTNEDVLRYIQTPAARRFLEAAPIPLDASPRAVSAPIGRVLWSVQAGVILGAAGIGLQMVSISADKDVAAAVSSLGVLALAIGAGFIVSAVLSYILSRRMGIWQPPQAMPGAADAHAE